LRFSLIHGLPVAAHQAHAPRIAHLHIVTPEPPPPQLEMRWAQVSDGVRSTRWADDGVHHLPARDGKEEGRGGGGEGEVMQRCMRVCVRARANTHLLVPRFRQLVPRLLAARGACVRLGGGGGGGSMTMRVLAPHPQRQRPHRHREGHLHRHRRPHRHRMEVEPRPLASWSQLPFGTTPRAAAAATNRTTQVAHGRHDGLTKSRQLENRAHWRARRELVHVDGWCGFTGSADCSVQPAALWR